jgi:hypothetical protein
LPDRSHNIEHFKAREHPSFFVLSRWWSLAWILLALINCQTFEAVKMSIRNIQFMTGHGEIVVSPKKSIDFLIAFKVRNFLSNLTINKTWHADCSKPAVSKILDWLVK